MTMISSTTRTKYTHLELGKAAETGIAGYYTPLKEVKLKYNGREILYVVGQAVVEASCCGTGSWTYTIVPGYIVNWQDMQNEAGLPVSEVESILDEEARANIRRIIQTNEAASLIEFR